MHDSALRRRLRGGAIARVAAGLLLMATSNNEARADAYDDALGRAAEAERAAHLEEELAVLEPARTGYPEDYALALQTAWTLFRLGRYAEAEAAYVDAVALSGGSFDSLVGLGWSLSRQRKCEEARRAFEAAAAVRPSDSSVRQGSASCSSERAWTFSPSLFVTGTLYSNNREKRSAAGGTLALDASREGGFIAGAAYRGGRYWPSSGASVSAFSQHEIYADAGYAGARYGLALQYALVDDGSGYAKTSHHAGLSGRWSPSGDLVADLSLSLYDDLDVFRASLSYRAPLGAGVSIVPGVNVERAAGNYGSGSVVLRLDRAFGGLWLGGRYGEEVRPAYLGDRVVFDVPERLVWGATAGASLAVGAGVGLRAAFEIDGTRRTDGLSPERGTMQSIVLGATASF